MIINLSPVCSEDALAASVSGDKITINGQEFDFSPLTDGILPRDAIDSPFFAGAVFRRPGGEIELTLILPHGPYASSNMTFPEPVRAVRGRVKLPKDQNPAPLPPAPLPDIEEVIAND